MKTRLYLFLLLFIVFNISCGEEDKTRDAWKKVNSALDKEKIVPQNVDSLTTPSSTNSYELANNIKNLFKSIKAEHDENDSIQLSSVKKKISHIQGIPDICKQVTFEVLKDGDADFYTVARLDSAEAVILDCIFTNMIEN